MLAAIKKELEWQKDFLGETVETIYFGGGTPSVLEQGEIENLLEQIYRQYRVADHPEITLEANPDDLTEEKVKALAQAGINRLSIGIQSFFDVDLEYMNRAHNAEEAKKCVRLAQAAGIHDISIDLIYGSPTTAMEMWEENMNQAFALDVPHISCYCLTVEPNTALDHFVKKGKAQPVDEAKASAQFSRLMERAGEEGFEHYEISNFAKPNRYSKHNTAYWRGKKYLGIGPSAHSYNGQDRQWNVAHNAQYIKSIQAGEIPFEKETLSDMDRYNEYVMISLRTQWGCDIGRIPAMFRDYFLEKVQIFLKEESMKVQDERYVLTSKGKHLADGIASDLFWIEEE